MRVALIMMVTLGATVAASASFTGTTDAALPMGCMNLHCLGICDLPENPCTLPFFCWAVPCPTLHDLEKLLP